MTSDRVSPVRRADELSFRRRFALYAVLILSSFACNYSFVLVDYVRPFLVHDLGMTLSTTALLYTAQSCGLIAGSFLMPILDRRWGSRAVICFSAAGVALFTLLSLHAAAFVTWAVSRFAVGVVLAGCYVSTTTMLANFFPPHLRGRLLAANMMTWSAGLLVGGMVGAAAGATGWRAVLWVAVIVSATVALISGWLLPDDREFAVYSDREEAAPTQVAAGRWSEMWLPGRWRLTLSCLALAGLNFSGYQFYSGFITTYLLNVRHFDASVVGSFVMLDGIGTFAGSLLWGWVADFRGRKAAAWGLGAAAIFIVCFLVAPRQRALLYAIELGYAVCLSATTCWSAYFAELFPIRLRPMGTSLFHGGHVISLFSPLLVATIARSHDLALGMSLAPAAFMIASLLWLSLPETLRTSRSYRGFVPDRAG